MEPVNILDCKNSDEFRNWLIDNHSTQSECWIECRKGKPREGVFSYIDAVYVLVGLILHML